MMKIEEGKFYRAANGEKRGPMEPRSSRTFPWTCGDHTYTEDGEYYENGVASSFDLIAEWTDEPKTWGEMSDAEKGALLLAHHEGKEIEILGTEWLNVPNPQWVPEYAYRIKPEPKVDAQKGECWAEIEPSGPSMWVTHQFGSDTNVALGKYTCETVDGKPVKITWEALPLTKGEKS